MFESPISDYTGSKAGAGVFQTIINHIPAHRVFVEVFAGSAAVSSKMKRPECLILNDIDPGICTALRSVVNRAVVFNYSYEILLRALAMLPGVFFYCDPPYLMETRSAKRKYYRYDWDQGDHEAFLSIAAGIDARVMISHYRCDMYDSCLKEWNRVDFNAMTRKGVRVESIYFNYEVPHELHDSSYAGLNFTDRQRIKRKADRLVKKVLAMPAVERQLILSTLHDAIK